MNDDKATEVARLIGELWPQPPMTDTRLVLYARHLRAVPNEADALRVIDGLFAHRFRQPTPADIIDRALGSDTEAALQWDRLVLAAQAVAESRAASDAALPASDRAIEALRAAGLTRRLPIGNSYQLDQARKRFVEQFTATARGAAPSAAAVLAPAHPNTIGPVNTTRAARRL